MGPGVLGAGENTKTRPRPPSTTLDKVSYSFTMYRNVQQVGFLYNEQQYCIMEDVTTIFILLAVGLVVVQFKFKDRFELKLLSTVFSLGTLGLVLTDSTITDGQLPLLVILAFSLIAINTYTTMKTVGGEKDGT